MCLVLGPLQLAAGSTPISHPMKIQSIIYLVAGTLVLTGLALGYWVDPRWLLLAAFVGVNLFQTAFTGFCPLERILLKLGVASGGGCCTGDTRKP